MHTCTHTQLKYKSSLTVCQIMCIILTNLTKTMIDRLGENQRSWISSPAGKIINRKIDIEMHRDSVGQERLLVLSQGWFCPGWLLWDVTALFPGFSDLSYHLTDSCYFKFSLNQFYSLLCRWQIKIPLTSWWQVPLYSHSQLSNGRCTNKIL